MAMKVSVSLASRSVDDQIDIFFEAWANNSANNSVEGFMWALDVPNTQPGSFELSSNL